MSVYYDAAVGILKGSLAAARRALAAVWATLVKQDVQRTREEALQQRLEIEEEVNELEDDELADRASKWVRRSDD